MKKIFFCSVLIALLFPTLANAQSPQCTALINDCKDEIINFAMDYLPTIDPDCKLWHGSCNFEGEIWREGSVSIGTLYNYTSTNQFSPKLTVKGGITTEQLQICKAAWCDFVFEDTFNLLSLKNVSAYIKKNGHLPGCTPGPEIESNLGFFVDELAVQQQQKIEETFLHLIQLNHRIANLKLEVSDKGISIPSDLPSNTVAPPEYKERSSSVVFDINCFQIQAASGNMISDGLVGITITNGVGPFTIQWQGGILTNVMCDGLIRIPNLAPGVYTFVVKNAAGQILGTCTTTVTVSANSLCDVFNELACKSALEALIKAEFEQIKPNCKQWEGGDCDKLGLIHRMGNVNIGTSNGKAGYSLAVAGGILTDNFKVELCSGSWCDYVFEPDYKLLPLEEVEKYIAHYKHLPGMISQAEVTKDGGYEMKTVKIDQQEKIEEATLHILNLKNEINKLKLSLEINN